ncbi:WecB/TagA/CpsF family glycosyltransferase [Scytonema sp. UIC 10036]|nr:WecB/TagA/CpsF family glycosyltransferase [Scytonema sp. UIC 10036]MUH00168.1 WecB/TagA/CpsF family glycosyltransferase [Scytonema sp. UIC 10036]
MPLRYSNTDRFHISKGKGLSKLPQNYQVGELPNLNVYLLERRITCMSVPAIVEAIYEASVEGRKITVANYNVHSFNLSMQLPWYYQFLQSADITHCDSVGILKAIRWMGLDLPIEYRSSYSLLMPQVLSKCNAHGFSVFFLGSKPQNLEIALNRLRQQYPNIRLDGHHGYFDKEDPVQNEMVIQKINQAKPNVLVLGMGMPIQEHWVYKHRNRLQVNAIMLGGAIVDRLAGIVPDCPKFLSHLGLEWLYRLIREPKRLAARYLLGNPAFLLQIALAKFYAPPLRVQPMQPVERTLPSKGTTCERDLSGAIYTRVKQIADYLIEANLLTQAQVETVLSEQKLAELLLDEVLVRKKGIKKQTLERIINKVVLPDGY